MRDNFNSYFDSSMQINTPGPDNGILYTSEYASLAIGDDQLTQRQVLNLLKLINPDSDKANWSRDNHFGFIALSKRFGLNFHESLYLSNIKYALQPWDLIFFLYASEGLIGLLATPFLFISSLAMIMTVLITSYKTINGQQVLATDGQILTWLTLNNFNLPLTKKICDFIVKKKYGSYLIFFTTYFPQNHPIVVLAKEKGI